MLQRTCRASTTAYAFSMLFVLMLSGCMASAINFEERRELPVPLEITLAAEERVNLTAGGRPSPIVVRLFELSNNTQFLAADYFALMGQDGVPIGGDILTSDEHVLLPGEVKMVRKRAALKSRYLGIVAGYSDLSTSTWRLITPLPDPYLAGRVWSRSVSPTKHLFVVLSERGLAVYEKPPKK